MTENDREGMTKKERLLSVTAWSAEATERCFLSLIGDVASWEHCSEAIKSAKSELDCLVGLTKAAYVSDTGETVLQVLDFPSLSFV